MSDVQIRIVCAALRLPHGDDYLLVLGPRHFCETSIKQMHAHALPAGSWAHAEQGFIDQFGNFHDRCAAWKIAAAANQILYRCGGDSADGGTLYSENLY